MIPFGSQRANGADLAVHLHNAHDNEYVELASLRGSIADDLAGAFAEWETQAHSMTKCEKYLYSLSINPDQRQGRLTREQYDDYIVRVEESLGLFGQPRAVVYHIKNEREHCHVVWSRIDIQDHKAIPIAFDKQKLMMITREFARDHGLKLPDGYYRDEDRQNEKNKQLSLQEKNQQDTTGLTKEERIALVTELWQQSDSAKAFVSGLEQNGYMLATGNRPYVLVDVYGHMNNLPKLIGDKDVRQKDVEAFLGTDYPTKELPSVDEARALVEQHRQTLKEHEKSEKDNDRRDQLKESQRQRRESFEKEKTEKLAQQEEARSRLEKRLFGERSEQRSAFLEEARRIRQQREETKPQGLAGFLARVTGVELIREKLHQREDRIRHEAFQEQKQQLQEKQTQQQEEQRREHEARSYEISRKEQMLKERDGREQQSLERDLKREHNMALRRGHDHMPSVNLDLKPPGRFAAPAKAKNRFTTQEGETEVPAERTTQETSSLQQMQQQKEMTGQTEMNRDFSKASEPQRDHGNGGSSGAGGEARSEPTFNTNKGNDNSQGRER